MKVTMNLNQIKLCRAQHFKFKEESFILFSSFTPFVYSLYPIRTAAHYFLFLNPTLNYNREFSNNLI